MKNNCLRRFKYTAAALAALLLLSATSACAGRDDGTETMAPSESVTLPDLQDTREPSSVVKYTERLTTAFANRVPTSADQFTYEVGEVGVTITGYTGGEIVVVLPDTIEEKPVVAIAASAFAGKGTIRALSIPDTVNDIAPGALKGCAALATLRTPMAAATGSTHFGSLFGAETHETNAAHVPAALTTLLLTGGDAVAPYAFYDCPMEAVALPDALTEIGAFAFYGNDKLVYIPLSKTALTSVGERAFTNCASLLSLEMPATVKSLGFAMLEGCAKLEKLTIPFVGGGSVPAASETETEAETETDKTTPSTDHFAYIFGAESYHHSEGYIPRSLITVALLEGCDNIPANAFFECMPLREVILPASVTAIGRRAFYGCERLSGITIPDRVTTVGDDAFHGCIRLVDLKVGAGVTTLGVQVFMDCLSLKSVTLPAGVTHLPNSAFAGCRSLETLNAPGVKTQGEQVFRHCDKLKGWSNP